MWHYVYMPKNRNMTFGDQQAQAAREKKLAKLKPVAPKPEATPETVPAKKKESKKKPSGGDL
jgi:hypothetical protein